MHYIRFQPRNAARLWNMVQVSLSCSTKSLKSEAARKYLSHIRLNATIVRPSAPHTRGHIAGSGDRPALRLRSGTVETSLRDRPFGYAQGPVKS
jgi:hypothetical protein